MKNNKTNLILILSTSLLVAFIVFFFYFFNVIKNKNKHTSVVISTLTEKISEKEKLSVLEKKMAELGDINKKINNYLVNPSNIDSFVEYLENTGLNNGVELIVKSVEIEKTEKNKILISVYMTGSFSNVIKVISLLENAPYNIKINSLSLMKEIEKNVIDSTAKNIKGVIPVIKSTWQSSITFSVLSL